MINYLSEQETLREVQSSVPEGRIIKIIISQFQTLFADAMKNKIYLLKLMFRNGRIKMSWLMMGIFKS